MHIGGHAVESFVEHAQLDVQSALPYIALIPRELPARARGLTADGTYTIMGSYTYRSGRVLLNAEVKVGDYVRVSF